MRRMGKKHVAGHGTKHHKIPKNYCFGCGKDNPEGMRLRFYFDEEKRHFYAKFRLGHRFTGPPEHAHGGIVATILDEAMGKVNKLRSSVALTRAMSVEYLKPVPLYKPLVVEAREKRAPRGRKHVNVAEIRNAKGDVLARGEATFVRIDPEKMFAKFLTPEQQKYYKKYVAGAKR